MCKKQVARLMALLLIATVVFVLGHTLLKRQPLVLSAISIDYVHVYENKLIVEGVVNATGAGFRGYDYEIEGEKLFLKLYNINWFQLLSSRVGPGEIEIEIIDDDIKNIRYVVCEEQTIWGRSIKM